MRLDSTETGGPSAKLDREPRQSPRGKPNCRRGVCEDGLVVDATTSAEVLGRDAGVIPGPGPRLSRKASTSSAMTWWPQLLFPHVHHGSAQFQSRPRSPSLRTTLHHERTGRCRLVGELPNTHARLSQASAYLARRAMSPLTDTITTPRASDSSKVGCPNSAVQPTGLAASLRARMGQLL